MKDFTCKVCKGEFVAGTGWRAKDDQHDSGGNRVCGGCFEKGIKCHYCLRILCGEEKVRPMTNDDGNIICDSCHDERYLVICPACEEISENDKQADGYCPPGDCLPEEICDNCRE